MLTIGPTLEIRHRNGFTMVELLIVILIIGLLATAVVPQLAATKERAFDRTVMSDIKRAHVAAEAYAAEYMTYPASASDAGFTPSSGVTFTRWQLQTQDGVLSVHLHAEHAMSSHYYHSHYPADPELEQRKR